MNEAITVEYELTEDLWRRFHEAHYADSKYLKVRSWYGAAMIAVGSFGLGGLFQSRLLAAGLILFGLYCVLARQLLIIKSLRTARKNPNYLGRMTVRLDREGIAVERESSRFSRPWSAFAGYRQAAPGYLFYLQPNSFFFVPQDALGAEDDRKLQRLLTMSRLAPL